MRTKRTDKIAYETKGCTWRQKCPTRKQKMIQKRLKGCIRRQNVHISTQKVGTKRQIVHIRRLKTYGEIKMTLIEEKDTRSQKVCIGRQNRQRQKGCLRKQKVKKKMKLL